MAVKEGVRFRTGVEGGDPSGYGPVVYTGTANAGTPSAGTAGFGAGTIYPGGLVISSAGKAHYINTGTLASPTWSKVTAV